MEALHPDPDDLPAMEIGDEQRREAAHRVDHVFLVIGGGRRIQRRSAESVHAIRFLATDGEKLSFNRNPQEFAQ